MEPKTTSQSSPVLGLMLIVGFVLIVASLIGIGWSTFSPPRQYYPVHAYSTVFADEPTGLRVIEPDASTPSEGTITADVTIVRPIPMKRRRGSWRAYDANHQPATEKALAKAGSEFGAIVKMRGLSASSHGPVLMTWPHPDGNQALPSFPFPPEKLRNAFDLLAADILRQSGNREYAEAARIGGVRPPALSAAATPDNRVYVYVPLVIGFLLLTAARMIMKYSPGALANERVG